MKKTYPTSKNARSPVAWHKHLRKDGKRRVNKSTRKLSDPMRCRCADCLAGKVKWLT